MRTDGTAHYNLKGAGSQFFCLGEGGEMWTLVPIILICEGVVSPKDCNESVALASLIAPVSEVGAGYVGCLRSGMLYAATSHLVAEGTYPKIVCVPPDRVAQTNRN